MAGDHNGLAENCRIDDDDDDDEDEDDEVGDGNAIGNNVDKDVSISGSSIITSKVSEMFSKITSLVCIFDFCALKLLLEHLNSLCKSCTCCKSCSFSLYCSSVPDLRINK